MGVITDTIRMQYLNNVKLDLEYKIQLVTQARMGLSQSASDLMQVGTDSVSYTHLTLPTIA